MQQGTHIPHRRAQQSQTYKNKEPLRRKENKEPTRPQASPHTLAHSLYTARNQLCGDLEMRRKKKKKKTSSGETPPKQNRKRLRLAPGKRKRTGFAFAFLTRSQAPLKRQASQIFIAKRDRQLGQTSFRLDQKQNRRSSCFRSPRTEHSTRGQLVGIYNCAYEGR